jgi:hypothetical protein
MWPAPDYPEVAERMRTAHSRARTALCVLSEQDIREAWGWRGRTLSQPVIASDGPAWLRVACAPADQARTTFWDGSSEAKTAIPGSVPRPLLRDIHDWSDEPWKYRAELYDRVTAPAAATSLALVTAPDLPPAWWAAVRTALDDIAVVPTLRRTVHQPFLDRAMPQFLGTPIDTAAPSWSTAHGDFHFANLCAPILHVLDWEGWGLAPTGYDAAVLHNYSLLVPSVATRIRSELAHILGTPAGRFAELAVITQLLHSTTHGDNLELAEPLRNRAAYLLQRAIPLSPAGHVAASGSRREN